MTKSATVANWVNDPKNRNDAIKLLARTEGIWTEPAGGTTLAAAVKLIQSGRIPKDDSIVVSITGNGLKTLEVVAEELPYPVVIDPKLTEFDRLFEEQSKKKEAAVAEPRAEESPVTAGV